MNFDDEGREMAPEGALSPSTSPMQEPTITLHPIADEFDFEEFPFEDESGPEEAWKSRVNSLRERSEAARYKFEEVAATEQVEEHVVVHLPAGRDSRAVYISDISGLESLLATDFDSRTFLSPYDAICSYERGEIEAALRPLNQLAASYVFRRLTGRAIPVNRATDEELTLVIPKRAPDDRVAISIGPMSETLAAMLGRAGAKKSRAALSIRNVHVTQHDAAVRLLERVSNSLFFQVDLEAGLPLALSRERRLVPSPSQRRVFAPEQIQFPRFEYDQRACQLYWYARSAVSMPLLQFLAYYQCVEFYFPIYSQLEAQRRVRSVLKHPSFSPHRDTDVNEVLSAARATTRGFGDERSQLRATIQECVTPESLRAFLLEDEPRRNFFSAKKQELGVQRLNLQALDADWRSDVADRVYDIRCKIVHTKHSGTGDDVELLLPFSKEADALVYDIQLVQFVARQVLVASSGQLHVE
jgi:hypothetical protein